MGIFLTKIEFNLGDFGLFLILQPKLIPRVIKALKLLDEMPYIDYMSFIRTPEWKKNSRSADSVPGRRRRPVRHTEW